MIQLGTYLHHHLNVLGALQYVFLFLIVWWSWSGTTYHANRFVSDDALRRLLVFLQIFAVVNMAVSVPEAFGERGAAFALSYAALRVMLVLMYLRAYRHEPAARPLIRNYVTGFSLGIFFWLVSAFVLEPWRYLLWAFGIGSEVLVHFAFGTQRLEGSVPFNLPHLSERYSLFILIVLGDSFIKAVGRVAEAGVRAEHAPVRRAGLADDGELVVGLLRRRGGGRLAPGRGRHHELGLRPLSLGGRGRRVRGGGRGHHAARPYPRYGAVSSVAYLSRYSSLPFVGRLGGFLTETHTPQLGLRRVYLRTASAALLLLVALFGADLSAPAAVGWVAAVCALQVLFDLAVGRDAAEVGEVELAGGSGE